MKARIHVILQQQHSCIYQQIHTEKASPNTFVVDALALQAYFSPDENFQDVQQYLPRKDRIVITEEEN